MLGALKGRTMTAALIEGLAGLLAPALLLLDLVVFVRAIEFLHMEWTVRRNGWEFWVFCTVVAAGTLALFVAGVGKLIIAACSGYNNFVDAVYFIDKVGLCIVLAITVVHRAAQGKVLMQAKPRCLQKHSISNEERVPWTRSYWRN